MIAYKVVEKQTRHCSNWTLFKGIYGGRVDSRALKFKKENAAYFPRYFKGKVITAPSGSPGIMCFTETKQAFRFKHAYQALEERGIVIKVRGFYRLQPIKITPACGYYIFRIKDKNKRLSKPPPGTVAFRKVLVLE